MKTAPTKQKSGRIRLPRNDAGYAELSDFFDRHDGVDLEYWNQPNTKQLNIRIPRSAKRMIERLAKRKTVEISTLVRMWVIESMRREAAQP
jgi:phage-related protein